MARVALKCRLLACGLLLLCATVAGVSAILLWQDYHVSRDILRLVSAGVAPESPPVSGRASVI